MVLRKRQKLGKYRIERCLAKGPFANVYQGFDTIEGLRYALKIPHPYLADEQFLADFRKEARMNVRLDHPNILPVKDASQIDGHFVIVSPLGERTLGDRLARRIGVETALDYTGQMLSAVAYAHERRIIHCDIKPDNFILFPGNQLRLGDFGIAKVAQRTVRASGSGTIGYLAPEQAMGRPCFQSDVFSLGLLIYRMLSGALPEWPFDWPPPGYDRFRQRVPPGLEDVLRRAMALRPGDRFANATQLRNRFERERTRAARNGNAGTRPRAAINGKSSWRALRAAQFRRRFGKALNLSAHCRRCEGPVSDAMSACPWCGIAKPQAAGDTRFPSFCPDCHGGAKLDWLYCGWCYGSGFVRDSARKFSDKRYTALCANRHCDRRLLMPFMRYCPWCRTRVERAWKIRGSRDTCGHCGWGVVREFWRTCPWCACDLKSSRRREP